MNVLHDEEQYRPGLLTSPFIGTTHTKQCGDDYNKSHKYQDIT